jgi:hypothetical protein
MALIAPAEFEIRPDEYQSHSPHYSSFNLPLGLLYFRMGRAKELYMQQMEQGWLRQLGSVQRWNSHHGDQA